MLGRQLTVDEQRVLSDLYGTVRAHHHRNLLRMRYHDGEDVLHRMAFSVPKQFDVYAVPVGWPKKAVDVIASRCVADDYSVRTPTGLVDDLRAARSDAGSGEHERQAIHAAVRYGVSFLFSVLGDPGRGEPAVVQFVRSPLAASVQVDPRTGATVSALEMLDTGAVLYLPGRVLTLSGYAGTGWRVVDEQPSTARVTVTPFVNCGTPDKPMGQSRITRVLMGLTDMGVRTLHRSEVSAEFYSAPREALISATEEMFTDANGNRRTGWEMILGGTWGIPDGVGPDGERVAPTLQHIPQMSMQPFLDQFRLIAAAVSGETAIPMSYLGVLQDSNPSSAEAIAASEMDLVRAASETTAGMTAARRSAAVDVLTVLHGDLSAAAWADLRGVSPRWVDPRGRSITEQSQFVQLQVAAGNLQPGVESTLRLLPMSEDEVAASLADNRRAAGTGVLDRLLASSSQAATMGD